LLIFEWLSKSSPAEICCYVIKLLFGMMFILHHTVHQAKKGAQMDQCMVHPVQ